MSGIVVPQANPGAGYRAHKQEIDAAVSRALDSGWYILARRGARLRPSLPPGSAPAPPLGVAMAPTPSLSHCVVLASVPGARS